MSEIFIALLYRKCWRCSLNKSYFDFAVENSIYIYKEGVLAWNFETKNVQCSDKKRFSFLLRSLMPKKKNWSKLNSLMMMMKNCFCGMVDRQKEFSLIYSRDHCQISSLSRISDISWAGFQTAPNLSSGFVEWSCAVVITTTPRRQTALSFWDWNILISKIMPYQFTIFLTGIIKKSGLIFLL